MKQQGTLGRIMALRDLKYASEELSEAADDLAAQCSKAKNDLEGRAEPDALNLSRLLRAWCSFQAALVAHEDP